jgi:Alkaline phosphatase PhoX
MKLTRRKKLALAGALVVGGVAAAAAIAAPVPGAETGLSSSQSPYVLRSQLGVVTKSILTAGDSVNAKPDGGTPYRMVGIPDGLGGFDNGDGTFTVLMNHELGNTAGVVRAHGARGSFVSKWTIEKGSLRVLHGEDLIQTLNTWNPALNGGAGDWEVSNTDAAPARLNRLCSADLPQASAFYNVGTGNGYDGRLFMDGEEGGTAGRPFGHVVATGQSYELTPWLGNMSFENVVANPSTGDATVVMNLDDGDASLGQQVYLYRGSKSTTGNPVQKAGLTNGALYGVKVLGIPQSEYQKTDWSVGNEFDFQLVDVSQYAAVGGANGGVVDTLDEDSQAQGVTNFQRPEDGAWDPNNPSDFYFVTTSSFGPLTAEDRTGETRLWRLRFEDPADPSKGGKLTLLVSGPIGTADSPSSTGTQSADSAGPQMFDNITVNDRGQVLLVEDVGNQAYLGGAWLYDIASGSLVKLAAHDPARFTPGSPGFLTKDEEMSGIISAPFVGEGWYLLDVQAHYTISGELSQGGQLLALRVPPGKFS